MKKKWVWIIAGTAIVLFAVFYFLRNNKTLNYRTAKISRGSISLLVSTTGSLNARNTVEVGSEVSGIIKEMYIDYNSRVKKGQVLLQIDPASFELRLRQRESSLQKAQLALKDRERDLERKKRLMENNLIAQSELDDAHSAYANALANLKEAEASYEIAIKDMKNTTITSPIEGTVISCPVSIGQTIAASFSAPTLIVIAEDLRSMQVEASVDEMDIGRIKQGQPVDFTVDAFPQVSFTGKVEQVRLSPKIIQNVVTYVVVISVSNEDLLLKPGMTANVQIITEKRENVLRVANAAFSLKLPDSLLKQTQQDFAKMRHPEEKGEDSARPRSTLWILGGDGNPFPLRVKAGLSDGIFTQIEHPELKEGDEVLVGITATGAKTTMTAGPFGMQAPRVRMRR